MVGEKTQKYTEEAKKLAEKHLDQALQHWRTKMGDEWRKTIQEKLKSDPNAAAAAAAAKAKAGFIFGHFFGWFFGHYSTPRQCH